MEKIGYLSGLSYAKLQGAAHLVGAGDGEWYLSYSRHIKHEKLSRSEGKIFSFLWIDDAHLKKLFHLGKLHDSVDFGFIDFVPVIQIRFLGFLPTLQHTFFLGYIELG